MYALQIDPKAPRASMFNLSWPGYWAGLGWTDDPKKAVQFCKEEEANRAVCGTHIGLNGCVKVVKVS